MLDAILSLPSLSHMSLHDEEKNDLSLNLDVLNSDMKYLSANDFRLKQYDQPIFSLLNFNIRSLSSKFADFTELVESSKTKLDVILFTESCLSDNLVDLFKIKSYKDFHSCRTQQKGGAYRTTLGTFLM